MKKLWNYLLILCAIALIASNLSAQKIIRVLPKEIDDVLINPGIGFNTFQCFNGDYAGSAKGGYPGIGGGKVPDCYTELVTYKFDSSLINKNYPQSSVAYFRINWSFIEPEQGKYRWDFIDGLLDIAHERNQTLMLRISPYHGGQQSDVPGWYREMVGPKRDFSYGNRTLKWVVDAEDPRYAQYFGTMIRALGARYDGHPDLDCVDVAIVGYAGEGDGTSLLTKKTMQALLDPYIESFKKTPLVVLLHGKEAVEYVTSKTTVGWRQDCLGDLGFPWTVRDFTPGWTHMYDYYPQTIIDYDMQDAWKIGPVTFEICGVLDTWDSREGYSDKQVQYIIDQSLKWHMSSFNAKSSPVPDKWKPMVDDWLRKMGYRFVLRNFKYPETVRANGKLSFESWWENKGVAPCYNKNYELALRLKNKETSIILVTDADIRKWLPGDAVYNDAVSIPYGFSPGNYELQISIVDRQSRLPRIKLAIEGIDEEGWYTLGDIEVTK